MKSRIKIHGDIIRFCCMIDMMFKTYMMKHIGFPIRSIETSTTFMRFIEWILLRRWRYLNFGQIVSITDLVIGINLVRFIFTMTTITCYLIKLKIWEKLAGKIFCDLRNLVSFFLEGIYLLKDEYPHKV
jgi:hypothetical protein